MCLMGGDWMLYFDCFDLGLLIRVFVIGEVVIMVVEVI